MTSMVTMRIHAAPSLLARKLATAAVLLVTISSAVFADPVTPPPGSPERKAICDALRVPVIKEFGVKPIFVIRTLNVMDGWAFLAGDLQRENGAPYNAAKLYKQRTGEDGFFDGDSVYGLLRKQNGRWKALDCHVGPTDVSFIGWHGQYGAPRRLFGVYSRHMQ
jgi:hypothetical protein